MTQWQDVIDTMAEAENRIVVGHVYNEETGTYEPRNVVGKV